MEKISVIIPVYNVEKYLNKCIESVINQTYKELEIILVDDGSPDNCPQMCDDWAKKDNRIKVIHKKNGGLSDARNAGLDIATSEYVYFIDSDDYIIDSAIEELFNVLIDNKCDIAFARYQRVYDDATKNKIVECTGKVIIESEDDYWNIVYNVNNDLEHEVCVNHIISCNKLFKKELFNKIRYIVGKKNEDELIIDELVSQCKFIAYFDKVLYFYYQNEDGIMGNLNYKFHKNFFDAAIKRIKYFKKSDKNIKLFVLKYYLNMLQIEYERFYKTDKEYIKMITKSYRRILYCSIKLIGELSSTEIRRFLLFFINPKLCYSNIFSLLRFKNK